MAYTQKVIDSKGAASGNVQVDEGIIRKTENAISQVELVGGTGAFNFVVQAKIRAQADGWADITEVLDQTDLDANNTLLVEHKDYLKMRHRYTGNTGLLNSWIQRG